MEEFLKGGSDAVAIFLYLLPGLVGLAVYDYLVEGPKREIFDRIVFALSLTLISTLCVNAFGTPVASRTSGNAILTISTMASPHMGYITATCIVLAVTLALLTNYAIPLRMARFLRMTYKTSSVDVWQDIFYKYRGYWIRITFADGRELVGWPQYFSAVGQPRELFVTEATWWIKDETGTVQSVEVLGAGVYISDFGAVSAIALLT